MLSLSRLRRYCTDRRTITSVKRAIREWNTITLNEFLQGVRDHVHDTQKIIGKVSDIPGPIQKIIDELDKMPEPKDPSKFYYGAGALVAGIGIIALIGAVSILLCSFLPPASPVITTIGGVAASKVGIGIGAAGGIITTAGGFSAAYGWYNSWQVQEFRKLHDYLPKLTKLLGDVQASTQEVDTKLENIMHSVAKCDALHHAENVNHRSDVLRLGIDGIADAATTLPCKS